MIRVLIAEDQATVRGALRALLAMEDDLVVVGEAGRADELIATARTCRPDVALVDIEMPGGDGIIGRDLGSSACAETDNQQCKRYNMDTIHQFPPKAPPPDPSCRRARSRPPPVLAPRP